MALRKLEGYLYTMVAQKPDPAELDPAAEEAEDDAAMAEYEAKGGISNAAMMAWVCSWGHEGKLPSLPDIC